MLVPQRPLLYIVHERALSFLVCNVPGLLLWSSASVRQETWLDRARQGWQGGLPPSAVWLASAWPFY